MPLMKTVGIVVTQNSPIVHLTQSKMNEGQVVFRNPAFLILINFLAKDSADS